jgi:type II secretory pathway pseudopilin PulG
MIEMVLVVVIMGIIVAIAAPKFADAESGRKLSSAKRIIESDIKALQLRARATGKEHVIAFYPTKEMYVAFEGSDIERTAIVLTRTLTNDPTSVELSRTDIGGDENIVVNVFGELEKDFSVGILDDGTEVLISFGGTDFTRGTVTEVDTPEDIETQSKKLEVGGTGLDVILKKGG